MATGDNAELKEIAKSTLAELPGEGNQRIAMMLSSANAGENALLLHLTRSGVDAVPQVVQALSSADSTIRHAIGGSRTDGFIDRLSLLLEAVAARNSQILKWRVEL